MGTGQFIDCPALAGLMAFLPHVAKSRSAVLLVGECGTGKSLIARHIHALSRVPGEFRAVSCLAPEQDLPAAIHAAFGAGGTVFLDELANLPLSAQETVLRLMRGQGSARVISATAKNLDALTEDGRFLQDVYYALNVIPVNIPPLRQRTADIVPLANAFLSFCAVQTKKPFTAFSPAALRALEAAPWPGNVRELRNAVERACLAGEPPVIHAADLGLASGGRGSAADFAEGTDRTLHTALRAFKREYVGQVLRQTGWNQTEAARVLGIQRTYVSKLITDLRIPRPQGI